MCFMILILENLDRLLLQNSHVLSDRVFRLHLLIHRDYLVGVWNIENVELTAMKLLQIVDIRG